MQNNELIPEEKPEIKWTFGKIVLVGVLSLLVLGGFLGTLCGGAFTLLGISGDAGFLMFSIPSFIIGLLISFLGYKLIRGIHNLKQSKKEYIILGILLVAIGIFMYFYFGFFTFNPIIK